MNCKWNFFIWIKLNCLNNFYDQTLRQHVLFLADASAVLTSTAASHPMKLIAWRPAIQIQTVDGSPTTTSPSSANW